MTSSIKQLIHRIKLKHVIKLLNSIDKFMGWTYHKSSHCEVISNQTGNGLAADGRRALKSSSFVFMEGYDSFL
jgi:hypothetical protein